jgi:hypothetical protein
MAVERGQGFFRTGVEVSVGEGCTGTDAGELLKGLQHLGGHATTAASAVFEFGKQVIAFLSPLGGSASVAAGLGDLGEGFVVLPGFLETEGFADLAGSLGMAFGDVDIAEIEMDAGELEQRESFTRFVLKELLDPQAFFDGEAGGLEVLPGDGFVSALSGGFALLMVYNADVLRGLAQALLVFQL